MDRIRPVFMKNGPDLGLFPEIQRVVSSRDVRLAGMGSRFEASSPGINAGARRVAESNADSTSGFLAHAGTEQGDVAPIWVREVYK